MGNKAFIKIMSLVPQVLLSSGSKQRCIANFKELPTLYVIDKENPPKPKASVLVPICVVNNEVCLLYTLRSSKLKNHSGQVSFPGGKSDGNETDIETALREAEEEIGLPREHVEIWGKMPTLPGRDSKLLITPVVGVIKNYDLKKLVRNIHEVEEIFTVSMSHFCDQRNHGHLDYYPPLPVFVCKYNVWGISGLITHLFLQSFLPEDKYKVDFSKAKFSLEELMVPQSPAKL